MLPLIYMITISPFLDYTIPPSLYLLASAVSMDILSSLPHFEGFPLRQDFLDKVKTLWPRRSLERNMHLTVDITTDDNYKVWIAMQASEPP